MLKYKATWYNENRIKALERDNYTCQDCKKWNAHLIVHHIKGAGRRNGRKVFDNSLDNLVTLCKKCHAIRHKFGNEPQKITKMAKMRKEGSGLREIAFVFKITPQRVSQILLASK
jgi:5-methylcytosine-specific restriction endonuclease McrA